MLDRLQDVPPGVVGLRATGRVSRADYEQVFEPVVDEARREGRRIRLLYELGPELEGFTAGGAWEDAKLGLRSMRLFDGCAIVTDIGWVRDAARVAGFFMPCPVHVFSHGERDEAIEWLSSKAQEPAVSHRLLSDRGVVVVEVTEALRAQDFDALAHTADTWIEGHGLLRGLVIHVQRFPGWENLGGLAKHLRFVRDHHRKVERVALSTDGMIAEVAPRLADHFVQAEMKGFRYDDLDRAIDWASKSAEPAEAQYVAGP